MDMETVYVVTAAAAGYLLGSVNLSIIISRLRGKDIRKVDSGNAGATNTLRAFGPAFAAIVFVFDFLKGFLPALLLSLAKYDTAACAYAFFAVLGHCFPLYFGFKGGKGVATSIGALFAIAPAAALLGLLEFIVLVLLFRFVSLASIVAAINIAAFTYFIYGLTPLFWTVVLIAALVIAGHRTNIVRIREGSENALFGKGKKKNDKV